MMNGKDSFGLPTIKFPSDVNSVISEDEENEFLSKFLILKNVFPIKNRERNQHHSCCSHKSKINQQTDTSKSDTSPNPNPASIPKPT